MSQGERRALTWDTFLELLKGNSGYGYELDAFVVGPPREPLSPVERFVCVLQQGYILLRPNRGRGDLEQEGRGRGKATCSNENGSVWVSRLASNHGGQ